MSGGKWYYKQDDLAYEMFGALSCDYGDYGHKQCGKARALNPMGDRELSELVWDVLCLIHSRDFCLSGDICEGTYQKDVEWFHQKWMKRKAQDSIEAYKQDLRDFADELIHELDQHKGDKDTIGS